MSLFEDRRNEIVTSAIFGFIAIGLIIMLILPSSQQEDILILNTGGAGETTQCINLASQYQIVLNSTNGDCYIRALANGTGVIITTNSTHLIINSTGGGGETTVCSGQSGNHIIVASSINGDCSFKNLVNGTGIIINSNGTHITISSEFPIPQEGQVAGNYLRWSGSTLTWQFLTHSTITFSTTLLLGVDVISCSTSGGDVTLTLPDITQSKQVGKLYYIKKTISANNCIIDPSGSETIDGLSTYTLTENQDSVIVIATSTLFWNTYVSKCVNTGIGEAICEANNHINSLIAGDGITITDTIGDLTFTSTCENTGTGEAICEANNNINSLIAGSGITIVDTTGDLTFTNTSPDNTVCANVGSGSEVYKDGECNFRTIICGISLTCTQNTNDITLDADLKGFVQGSVFQSVTKTNIGTAYIDVYVSAFDNENQMVIDCTNIIDYRITYIWDYVGSGTQQIRWVDVSDNNNVLYESPTFTSDRDAIDSGWFTKPAWCNGIVTIELQGKSTTAGDDPQAKGYVIHAR